ncbi:hypothetical protein [Flindersiella endophytica]
MVSTIALSSALKVLLRAASSSRDKHERLAHLETGRRSVAGAFRLSYDLLDAKQQRLFRLLGLHPGADFDTYAAAALSAQSLRETEHALEAGSLRNVSWIAMPF